MAPSRFHPAGAPHAPAEGLIGHATHRQHRPGRIVRRNDAGVVRVEKVVGKTEDDHRQVDRSAFVPAMRDFGGLASAGEGVIEGGSDAAGLLTRRVGHFMCIGAAVQENRRAPTQS
jgi:hypothetical protein